MPIAHPLAKLHSSPRLPHYGKLPVHDHSRQATIPPFEMGIGEIISPHCLHARFHLRFVLSSLMTIMIFDSYGTGWTKYSFFLEDCDGKSALDNLSAVSLWSLPQGFG